MKEICVGIIGVGNIGCAHAQAIYKKNIYGLKLSALFDTDRIRIEKLKKHFLGVEIIDNEKDFFDYATKKLDAVIIAVPHPLHKDFIIKSLNNNLHVLCEKPMCISADEAIDIINLSKDKNKICAVMFNQRANSEIICAKDLISKGTIGEMVSANLISTSWYRKQDYYNSDPWRATWVGENGGVLINQSPHNLDLWQYLCGMPKSINTIYYKEGKYHNIEVDDEVCVLAEYANGAILFFNVSTGIQFGSNRFEISGTKGKIKIENHSVYVVDELGENIFKCENEDDSHILILRNFSYSLLNNDKELLIAPFESAVNEVILRNAIYSSAWQNKKVEIPSLNFLNSLERKKKNSKEKNHINHDKPLQLSYKDRW